MKNKRKIQKKGNSAAAGAGGGSLIVFITEFIKNDTWSKILIYIAPWIAIGWNYLWNRIQTYADERYEEKNLINYVTKAKDYIKAQLEDVTISDEHRKELQLAYENLNLITINAYKDKADNYRL